MKPGHETVDKQYESVVVVLPLIWNEICFQGQRNKYEPKTPRAATSQ